MIPPVVRSSRAQAEPEPIIVRCPLHEQAAQVARAISRRRSWIERVDAIEHALEAAVLAERRECEQIAESEAVAQAEKMAAATERDDIKTADMLEAQVVTASKIQAFIRARGAGEET